MSDKQALEPDDYVLAEVIVNSEPVVSVYASCEWGELGDDGKTWIATIVREARGRTREDAGIKAPHPSHELRSSDASTFDFICEKCGCTDEVHGGWGKLALPCSRPSLAGDEVERVAKALCDVATANARRDLGDDAILPTYGWEDWLPDARAALAAMDREPVDQPAAQNAGEVTQADREAALRAALRCAVGHIEHQAAWIIKQKGGYSFESLGEDMPGIKQALSGQGEA